MQLQFADEHFSDDPLLETVSHTTQQTTVSRYDVILSDTCQKDTDRKGD
jgi:hypothetical protein